MPDAIVTLDGAALTTARTYDFPDADGTFVLQGAITGSGLTIATNRLAGRTTSGTGALEEIAVGSGLTFSSGSLSANVTSVAGRTGAVTLTDADISGLGTLALLNSVDLTSNVTGILPSANGGTANGYTKFSGPASSEKTFTLPNASSTILTDNAAVTVAQGGTGATTLTGYLKGNSTSPFTASASIPNTDVTGLGTMSTQNATAVNIDGGAIDGTPIGASSASTGAFTTLTATGKISSTSGAGTNALQINATARFYLDGGNNTWIEESSGDIIAMVCAGNTSGSFTTTGLNGCAIGATVPATAAVTTLTASSKLSVGTSSILSEPLAWFRKGSAGTHITWSTADVIVVENTAGDGATIQLFAQNNQQVAVGFSDPDGRNTGRIYYDHNTDLMGFRAGATNAATITSTGLNSTEIGATTPAAATVTTLTANGTSDLCLTSGKASIGGTTGSDYKLSVYKNTGSAGSAVLRVRHDGTGELIRGEGSGGGVLFTMSHNGAAVFNEAGLNTGSFRIEGDADANLVFSDAANDRVGIGTATPEQKLHVSGTARVSTSASAYTDLADNRIVTTVVASGVSYEIRDTRVASATASNHKWQMDMNMSSPAVQIPIIGAERASGLDCNIAIFGDATSINYQSGAFVIFLANRSAAPTGNPAGGGFLFAESGAAKWRGSSGTVTTFGPADPHCPECGTDYVHEWDNDVYGYLAVCMNCYAEGKHSHTRCKGAWSTHGRGVAT